MTIKEIEVAIAQLPATDLADLMTWLEKHHAEVWDKQIEEDLDAGRLDALIVEIDAEVTQADLDRAIFRVDLKPATRKQRVSIEPVNSRDVFSE